MSSTAPPSHAALTEDGTRPLLRPRAAAWFGALSCALAWEWLQPAYVHMTGGRNFGLLLAAAGPLLLAFGLRPLDAHRRQLLGRALTALAILGACAATDRGLRLLEAARQPRLGIFNWLGAALLQGVGAEASMSGPDLLLHNHQGLFVFSPTFGAIGLRSCVVFVVAACLVALASRLRPLPTAFLRIAAYALVFVTLRYSWAIVTLSDTDAALSEREHAAVALLYSPHGVAAALTLAAALLAATRWRTAVHRAAGPVLSAPESDGGWKGRPRLAAWLLAGLALGSAAYWSDPGEPKAGRVLIDDRLSGDWEPAGRLLTEDRFGDFSAYSFSAMTEHLSRRFLVDVEHASAYTRERLDDYDVLILKTPHGRLAPAEVSAIQEWVHDGGGLFAIGDHTDLSGMNTVLNRITAPMGIVFRFDATGTLVDQQFDLWRAPWIPEHPISADLELVELMTGCSLALSGSARPVLTLTRSGSAVGDYSLGSNFGALAPDPGRPHGLLVAAAAADYGEGRVLGFSDSTILSSFAYYNGEPSEFVLRGTTWLNQRGSWSDALPLLWTALAAVLLFLAFQRARDRGLTQGLGTLGAGWLCGAWTSSTVAAAALAVPAPAPGSAPVVSFVTEGGYAFAPPVLGSQPELERGGNLSTFIQVPQRLGYETRIVQRDPAALDGTDVLVVLNPDAQRGQPDPTEEWLSSVADWVSAGGSLVVTIRGEHIQHGHDRSRPYLHGLEFEPLESPEPGLELARARVGEGQVLRIVGSELLDVEAMGHCMDYPGAVERRRYATGYLVFRDLCGPLQLDRRTYLP